MNGLLRFAGGAWLAAVLTWPLAAVLPPRTISVSRQFALYADDATQRSASASIAEEVKLALLEALGLKDEWKCMIVVLLRRPSPSEPDAPPRLLTVGQTGAGLKIQLELALGEAGRGLRFRDEVLRALLAELSYRPVTDLPAGAPFRAPPDWMVEGLGAFFDSVRDDGTDGFPTELFQTLLRAGPGFDPFSFLSRSPAGLDATSRQLYRACAFGVIRLLLRDLPGGRVGLIAMLRALPESGRGDVGDLPRFCPELAQSADGLARWWAIALSRAAAPDPRRLLSAAETDAQLARLLAFPPEPPQLSATLADMPARLGDRKRRDPAAAQLAGARTSLLSLLVRAHPMIRPSIVEGIQLIDLALARKTGDLAGRLRAFDQSRRAALRTGDAVADYLNWYEATQMTEPSGAFAASARREEAPPARHDAVTEYLDALESELAGSGPR